MARLCITLFCCMLLMLFVTNELMQVAEARKQGENFKCYGECAEGKLVTEEIGTANPSPGDLVDAFRPTTPGHSPGVGHSIHN